MRSARPARRLPAVRRRSALCVILVAVALPLLTLGPTASAQRLGGRPVTAAKLGRHARACRRVRSARARAGRRKHCGAVRRTTAFGSLKTLTVAITSGPAAGGVTTSASATFAFRASVGGARFECSLDSKAYSRCNSPAAYSALGNGQHRFHVYAVDGSLVSPVVSVAWVVALPTPASGPSVPSGLKATAGNAQVVLSWSAPSDTHPIAGYVVFRDGAQVGQATATTYTDTGLTNGTTYGYTVEARDAAGGVSAPSAPVMATPAAPVVPPAPPPPTDGSPPAPLTAWVPPTAGFYTPLSDVQAAAEVTPEPENRPANTPENDYMPTAAQLLAFYAAKNQYGQTVVQANPYYAYVTGHYTGTTDEIIQWAAWKWGIPADWLRAEYVQESRWNMSQLGDIATVTPAVYAEYPPQARIPNSDEVYTSMGITQIKWAPDGSVGAGTEPLRWESTAFNVDYQAATLRFYYDNPDGLRSAWGDSTYAPGNAWDSLGGWYEPYPWLNSGQLNYISEVQQQLASRDWAQPGF
jgi:chitodextrinase